MREGVGVERLVLVGPGLDGVFLTVGNEGRHVAVVGEGKLGSSSR
jgi:hypothetical protein